MSRSGGDLDCMVVAEVEEIDGLGYIMELEVTDVADGMDMEVEETKGIWKTRWVVLTA